MALSLQDIYNSPGLRVDSSPFIGPPKPTTTTTVKRYTGKVLGASITAPPPATPTPVAANPAPTPTPISTSPAVPPSTPPVPYNNPVDDYYNSLNRAMPTVSDEAAIREQARKDFQAYLDAINAQFDTIRSDALRQNANRTGQTRAINARSGLLGSDFGNANAAGTEQVNEENLKAIEAERNLKLQDINGKIEQRAKDEIAAKKAEAAGNAEKYIERLAHNQDAARNDIKTLASSGAKIDSTTYAQLQKQSGYDPLTFEAIFNANKPVPEYFAPQQLKDGSLIIVGKDGSVKNLGQYDLPDNSQIVFAPDGTPLVFDKDTGITKIAAGFYKGQFASNSTKDTRTALEKEYEYARKQGYTGSLLEYQKKIKSFGSSGISNIFGDVNT